MPAIFSEVNEGHSDPLTSLTRLTFPWCYLGSVDWILHLGARWLWQLWIAVLLVQKNSN